MGFKVKKKYRKVHVLHWYHPESEGRGVEGVFDTEDEAWDHIKTLPNMGMCTPDFNVDEVNFYGVLKWDSKSQRKNSKSKQIKDYSEMQS